MCCYWVTFIPTYTCIVDLFLPSTSLMFISFIFHLIRFGPCHPNLYPDCTSRSRTDIHGLLVSLGMMCHNGYKQDDSPTQPGLCACFLTSLLYLDKPQQLLQNTLPEHTFGCQQRKFIWKTICHIILKWENSTCHPTFPRDLRPWSDHRTYWKTATSAKWEPWIRVALLGCRASEWHSSDWGCPPEPRTYQTHKFYTLRWGQGKSTIHYPAGKTPSQRCEDNIESMSPESLKAPRAIPWLSCQRKLAQGPGIVYITLVKTEE